MVVFASIQYDPLYSNQYSCNAFARNRLVHNNCDVEGAKPASWIYARGLENVLQEEVIKRKNLEI